MIASKHIKKEAGFGTIIALLIVFVVAILIASGWFVFRASTQTKITITTPRNKSATKQQSPSASVIDPLTLSLLPVNSWPSRTIAGSENFRYLSFSYPSDWFIKDFGASRSTVPTANPNDWQDQQLLTSPGGDPTNNYAVNQRPPHGFQIAISEQYSVNGNKSTSDCQGYGASLYQSTIIDNSTFCFYGQDSDSFIISGYQCFVNYNLSLFRGSDNTLPDQKYAVQVFMSVAHSMRFYSKC